MEVGESLLDWDRDGRPSFFGGAWSEQARPTDSCGSAFLLLGKMSYFHRVCLPSSSPSPSSSSSSSSTSSSPSTSSYLRVSMSSKESEAAKEKGGPSPS